MSPAALLLLAAVGDAHVYDAPLPQRPEVGIDALRAAGQPHKLGEWHTLFVNFDGITLSECNPSDSHRNCSWYNFGREFAPFSGSDQTKLAILQAMRQDASGFGLRITAQRPPDEEAYTMVVYGGTEEEIGTLGSAPSGDCWNALPNQIAFAHVDGELRDWVNGGANTALHEAAHSWGLDHIDVEGTVMFPAGDNSTSYFNDGCAQIVDDTALNPGEGSCPELNARYCNNPNQQHEFSILRELFGDPYVDTVTPTVELLEPLDGQYFQAPASFDVVLDVRDDLHPQPYSQWVWIEDLVERPSEPSIIAFPGFSVEELPIGEYLFHVVIADHEGHEASLDFMIEVGEDPPPDPVMEEEGCGCRTDESGGWLVGWLLVPLVLRRRRR